MVSIMVVVHTRRKTNEIVYYLVKDSRQEEQMLRSFEIEY
jgi:hypothetical protein